MDAAAWNERYAGTELVWTAEPNRFVVEQLADDGPGTALDLACGEGRNAVWLAGRGWSVRAVDFAEAAIVKGRQLAGRAGVDVNWVVADVTRYDPRATFDLVLMSYLHLPWPTFVTTLAKAVQALAPGGTLLVVGHHLDNLVGGVGGPQDASVLQDPDAIAAAGREAAGVEVVEAARVERPVLVDGHERIAVDSLVRLRRR